MASLALVVFTCITFSLLFVLDTSSTADYNGRNQIFVLTRDDLWTNEVGNEDVIESELSSSNGVLEKVTKVGGKMEIIKFAFEIIQALEEVINDKDMDDNFKEIFGKLDRNFQSISNVQETIDRMMTYSMDAFDMLQKRLNQSTEEIMADIDNVGKKVDRNYGYLLEIFRVVSEIYSVVEKTRFEMHDEFNRALVYAKSSRIEPIITKLNNFVIYFSNEKARISQLVRDERLAIFREESGFLQHLRDSRTPKGDSLQTFLHEIINDGYAIPQDANDTIAYAALSSMYYGIRTEISVLRYLVRVNIYLADDSYRKRDIGSFNQHMDQLVMDFKAFQDTLIGNSGFIDEAVKILKAVAQKGFPASGESTPENLRKRASYLTQEKLNITDATLPLIQEVPEKFMAQFKFDKSPRTPIGSWVDGSRVSYAMQYRNSKNMFSKVGEWSDPFTINGSANPTLRVAAHSTARLIFRRFNDDAPQFVGILEPSQTDFWDINRDVYNAASSSDETKAVNDAEKLIDIGANISAQFDLSSTAIHAAAKVGNVVFVKLLLNDTNIPTLLNETDTNGYTPLHTAAEWGWQEFVDLMIQLGSDVNSRTHSGSTPLHLAVTKGEVAAVLALLNSTNVDINAQDDEKAGPLHKAVHQGFESIVQTLLLDSRIDVNLESNGSLTALHLSVLLNNPEITGKLLAHGARLNTKSSGNMTALHYATINGNIPALKLLVDLDGTDVNAMSVNGWTPLHYAVSLRRNSIADELLKINKTMINVLAAGQITPLQLAAATDQASAVAQLLDHGALIGLPTTEGLTALQLAIINFNKDVVAELLKKDANLGARTANGSTILHLAAASGNMQTVKFILELGNISLNVRDNKMATPLELAIRFGHSDVAALLMQKITVINSNLIQAAEKGLLRNVTSFLEEGAEVNSNNTVGETPLHKAVVYGHLQVAEYLLQLGANVDRPDCAGETPLHKAVRNDSLELINYLIKVGADVDVQSTNGWTPLHLAIALGKTRSVEALLKTHKVKVNLPSFDMLTPLHLAAINGSAEFVNDLLANGAFVDAPNKEGLTALHLAAVNNHGDIMGILMKKGANVNARTTNGSTIVHLAVIGGNLKVIQQILETGNAKLSVRDDHMSTPLLLAMRQCAGKACAVVDALKQQIGDISVTSMIEAVKSGHVEQVRSLLLRGADVDGADEDGMTPLLWAAAEGRLDAVQFLVDDGAMVDARDSKQRTPLNWAAYWGHGSVVEYLLKNGAACDSRDIHNRSPLFYSAMNGYFFVVQDLVGCGASVSVRDSWNETPLFWARRNNHPKIAQFLISHGARE